jgi:hypothetical protein
LIYKLVGSEEEINKKAAEAMTLINNQTSKEIKDAKGNSFLINQILGRKEKAEKDIYKAIESKLNAVDTVNMTETSVNQEDPFGKKNNIRLTTFVPLNIADERNNLIINGVAVGNLNENQMQLVNGYMNEFLYNKAVVGKSKDVNAQGTITKIYRKLYKGDSKLTKEFSEYILGRDKNLAESYNKVLSTTDKNNNNDTNINEISKDNVNTDNVNTDNVNTDNNSKINYQVTKENGEDGLSINGVFN